MKKCKFKIGDRVRIINRKDAKVAVSGDITAFYADWQIINVSYHTGTYVRIKRIDLPVNDIDKNGISRVYLSETIIDIKHLRLCNNALQKLKIRYEKRT